MDLKDFLKPTKAKVIAFVILLLVSAVYFVYAIPCPISIGGEQIGGIPDTNFGTTGGSTCGKLPLEVLALMYWPIIAASAVLSNLGSANAGTGLVGMLKLMLRILIILGGLALNLLYLYAISTAALKLLEKLRKNRG